MHHAPLRERVVRAQSRVSDVRTQLACFGDVPIAAAARHGLAGRGVSGDESPGSPPPHGWPDARTMPARGGGPRTDTSLSSRAGSAEHFDPSRLCRPWCPTVQRTLSRRPKTFRVRWSACRNTSRLGKTAAAWVCGPGCGAGVPTGEADPRLARAGVVPPRYPPHPPRQVLPRHAEAPASSYRGRMAVRRPIPRFRSAPHQLQEHPGHRGTTTAAAPVSPPRQRAFRSRRSRRAPGLPPSRLESEDPDAARG